VLLDAQVAFHVERLTGDRLEATVVALAEQVLTAAGGSQLEDLVDREVITSIVVRALETVPASAAVGGILELATDVLLEGPAEPFPVGELADRDEVQALVDSVLALAPVLERLGESLADAALVGTVASRFMGRVVGEVVAANQAVADKVPGLGSLMSLGTSAASRVMGAAEGQLEGIVGRGGAFAVRRLNRIVIDTLLDPTTRLAAMESWDLVATTPVVGLSRYATAEQVTDLVDAVHEVVITGLATEHAADLVEVVVDGFFDRFGGYTPTELLEQLDLDRDELVAHLVRLAPAVVTALQESGDLERLVRAQLEPFYTSAEVAALLG
jgi:hypothetical protein